MDFEEEREKLFEEVWQDPMTTVAKRYDLSDNGLRKRCIGLQIPLPPAGYWAKLKAGKPVPAQPELPPYQSPSWSYQTGSKQNRIITYINVQSLTREQLEALDPMDLLTTESKDRFIKWCNDIHVPKTPSDFDQLIFDYLKEVEYRKARDEEHRFRNVMWNFRPWASKIIYRDNKAVLPITTSNKLNNRALRIINTIINLVKELDSKVSVKQGVKDNAVFSLLNQEFSFRISENMVKRRFLIASQPNKNANEFRPMYEKVFNGKIEIRFSQKPDSEKGEAIEFSFQDLPSRKIEVQLGGIFQVLCRSANQAEIARIIMRRENETKEQEQRRLRRIEEEKRRAIQQAEEQQRRKKRVSENIEQQMEGWYKSQKLRKFAEELKEYTAIVTNENTKELLLTYIGLINEKAENYDPVTDITKEVRVLLNNVDYENADE